MRILHRGELRENVEKIININSFSMVEANQMGIDRSNFFKMVRNGVIEKIKSKSKQTRWKVTKKVKEFIEKTQKSRLKKCNK